MPEIAGDIHAVDRALQLGYNWTYGPFELIDRIGADVFDARLRAAAAEVPDLLALAARSGGFYRIHEGRRQSLSVDGVYRDIDLPDGVVSLIDIKLAGEPIKRNGSASLWDIGDGVACL